MNNTSKINNADQKKISTDNPSTQNVVQGENALPRASFTWKDCPGVQLPDLLLNLTNLQLGTLSTNLDPYGSDSEDSDPLNNTAIDNSRFKENFMDCKNTEY